MFINEVNKVAFHLITWTCPLTVTLFLFILLLIQLSFHFCPTYFFSLPLFPISPAFWPLEILNNLSHVNSNPHFWFISTWGLTCVFCYIWSNILVNINELKEVDIYSMQCHDILKEEPKHVVLLYCLVFLFLYCPPPNVESRGGMKMEKSRDRALTS